MPRTVVSTFPTGLGQIEERLADLKVSDDKLDVAGDWTQTYSVLSGDSAAVFGRLLLTRKTIDASAAQLDIGWHKGAGGTTHWRLNGTVRTNNSLADPGLQWSSEGARYAGPFDAPTAVAERTAVRYGGRLAGGTLSITGPHGAAQKYTGLDVVVVSWQLFDFVQRLPRTGGFSQAYTLIDQFELVKPRQTVSYRGASDVDVNGVPRKLHRFDGLGVGTVPWTFWVDDQSNRLLAAVSGLEAYVLGELPRGGGHDRAGGKNKKASDQY